MSGRLLRSVISLLVAVGILAVALPVAFHSGAARLSVAGLVPGQSRTAIVRIANSGAESASFSLLPQLVDRAGADGVPLSRVLRLRVEALGSGEVLYEGPIGRLSRLALGGFAAGAERAYRFTVALPGSAGNEIEGASLGATFAWLAS